MSNPGLTLQALFLSAKQKQEQLSHVDPRSDTYKELQRGTMLELMECRDLVTRTAMFSVNEEIEDISTQDIPYLAIEHLLGELLLKSYEGDRRQTLRETSGLFDGFLTRLDQYDILSVSDKKLYEQFQESSTSFTLAATTNAEERRRVKVARFQEEKALKTRLEYLRNKSKSITTDDGSIAQPLPGRAFLVFESDFPVTRYDHTRNCYIGTDALSRTQQPSPRRRWARSNERLGSRVLGEIGRSDDLAWPGREGPLLDKSGKPLQPFTLTDKRTQLKDGVFRPGHNLPTMSIDEYLEEEKRRGGILDSNNATNGQTVEFDEDNDAHVDAATAKAREWDEFVEANPKGAGNTINRG